MTISRYAARSGVAWTEHVNGRESIIGTKAGRRRLVAFVLASVVGVSLSGSAAPAKVLIVNSRADPGDGACNRSHCTLREAIGKANGRVGLDQVRFRIGKGPATIEPATPLPPVTDAATLNGWAQPGFKRAPLIELSGAAAGPGSSGLVIDGPEVTIKGMVINRFAGNGIDVGGASFSGKATIQGSYVGTDRKGKLDRGNADHGVLVGYLAGVTIGGPAPKQRVVVSGNGADGVRLEQSDVGGFPSSITGSRIGTNAAGTVAVPNVGDGVHWSYPWGATIGGPANGPDDNANNLISGNGGAGIALLSNCLPICAAQNVIDGNRIGTNRAGTAALPNGDEGIYMSGTGDTVVGGGVGNLISGNGSHGVYVQNAAGGSILGNAVGINSSIDGVIPNGDDGIHLEPGPGGFHVGGGGADSNVVGGNGGHGIYVGTTNTQLYSNYVGVYPGRTNLGNSLNGIQLAGDALVGGTGPSQANEIAFNDGNGIGVSGGVSGISANSIHDNDGLGIDLGNDGATANDALDADTGPNFLQNKPVISSVISTGFSTDVTVELDSVAGTAMTPHAFTIELFSNPADTCDAAGGEGATYRASIALATDTSGHGSGTVSLTPPLSAGTELAATALDAADVVPWTSEFSGCYTVPSS